MALLRRKVKGRDSVLQDGVNDGGEGVRGVRGDRYPGWVDGRLLRAVLCPVHPAEPAP